MRRKMTAIERRANRRLEKGFCRIPLPTKRQERVWQRRSYKKHHKGLRVLFNKLYDDSLPFYKCPGRKLELEFAKAEDDSPWDYHELRDCNRHFGEKTKLKAGSVHLVNDSDICYALKSSAERLAEYKQRLSRKPK